MNFSSFVGPVQERKFTLGGELRHEEHRLSRTGVRVDRDATVDYLSDGDFALLSPAPSSGTIGDV
jgi:hypothetical protein